MNAYFFCGIGLGVAAGVTAAKLMHPSHKKRRSKAAGKAIKAVGSVVETVADVMSR